jgi:hypothetical protein
MKAPISLSVWTIGLLAGAMVRQCIAGEPDTAGPRADPAAAGRTTGRAEAESRPMLRDELLLKFLKYAHYAGRASIRTEQRVVMKSEQLAVEVRFECEQGDRDIYDAFFSTGDPVRAALRVFDEKGNYVGNALTAVPCAPPGRQRWLYVPAIPGRTTIGRAVRIETGDRTALAVIGKGDRALLARLGPGKYQLQFVLFWHFLDPPTDPDRGDYAPRPPSLNIPPSLDESEEICRTDVLQIEVLPVDFPADERPKQLPPFSAQLEVGDRFVRFDKPVRITTEVHNNTNEPANIIDPIRLQRSSFEAMKLLVFDDNDRLLGDLFWARLNAPTRDAARLTLPPGAIIGLTQDVYVYSGLAAAPPGPKGYKLQMAFLDRFVADDPYAGLPPPYTVPGGESNPQYIEAQKRWDRDHPGNEHFRSNAVKIVIGPSN